MPPRLAIIAALSREIAALVRGTKPDADLLRRGIHLHRLPHAIVVAGGMGSQRVTLAFQAAVAAAPVTTVISTGLAGSCTSQLAVGDVVEASMVIEARTGERFSAKASQTQHILVTTETIASIHEKARLAETYAAAIVDMEAATVARLASAHDLSFRAIKAISDAHDFELASLSRFAGKNGHFRTGAFALHTALRPHHWPKAMQLGRASTLALTNLHEALREVMREAEAMGAGSEAV
jgi:adenosylhomocysteine nucleosidase